MNAPFLLVSGTWASRSMPERMSLNKTHNVYVKKNSKETRGLNLNFEARQVSN